MTATSHSANCSNTFSFRVVLEGVEEVTEQLEDTLFESGCNDASLASRDRVVFLDFERQAESLSSAVGSAIDEIEAAGCRIASIGIGRRAVTDLATELAAWEAASDEDFASFEGRME